MKESTYWARQYTKFVDEALRYRKNILLSQANRTANEVEGLILFEKDNLKDNPEGFVLFLQINAVLNIFDPIGIYPQSLGEYSAYARNILDFYKSCNKKEFAQKLPGFLQDKLGRLFRRHKYRPQALQSKVDFLLRIIDQFEQKNEAEKNSFDELPGNGSHVRQAYWKEQNLLLKSCRKGSAHICTWPAVLRKNRQS